MSDAEIFGARDPSRAVIAVEGSDAAEFLQGLLTNDVDKAAEDRAVYAALLTPQGKYLADMIVTRPAPERFLLDAHAEQALGLVQRLSMYKLRAQVSVAVDPDLSVVLFWSSTDDAPQEAVADPRDARLGARLITAEPDTALAAARAGDLAAYEALRLSLAVPASGTDLRPNESFVLESDFERLNGVDFRKGCYVGQEIMARMHHKTELKKGLRRLSIDGDAASGAALTKGGKPVGALGSTDGAHGLAVLRLDRVGDGLLDIEGGGTATVLDQQPVAG